MQHFLVSFFITDFDECATEGVTHLLQELRVEVAAAMHSFRRTAETGLASVAVDELELSPHHDSRARLFAFMNDEGAIIEAKILIHF